MKSVFHFQMLKICTSTSVDMTEKIPKKGDKQNKSTSKIHVKYS